MIHQQGKIYNNKNLLKELFFSVIIKINKGIQLRIIKKEKLRQSRDRTIPKIKLELARGTKKLHKILTT